MYVGHLRFDDVLLTDPGGGVLFPLHAHSLRLSNISLQISFLGVSGNTTHDVSDGYSPSQEHGYVVGGFYGNSSGNNDPNGLARPKY